MKELTNMQLARLEETFNFNESSSENEDDELFVEENGSIEPEKEDVSE